MKNLGFSLAIILLLLGPSVALAGQAAERGHYTDPFFYEEDYLDDDRVACYYGEDVHVVYEAVNAWTFVVQNGDVRETLTQNGTATVYALDDGALLDTRGFHATERFYDGGGDVAVRHEGDYGVWYQVSHDWWNPDLEDYHYIWKIPGVYDFRAWNRNGEWSYSWRSGDCDGGYPDGWPPIPPHPFGGRQ
jgi:hypothetical protein